MVHHAADPSRHRVRADDDFRRTEFEQALAAFRRADGCDDFCPGQLYELHREPADTAGCAGDQHSFAE